MFIRYLHNKGRALGYPASTTFEITPRCNFSCKMCYIHNGDCNKCANEELSAEQWIEIGKQARDSGVILALITGGEPLIRKDFPYIYSSLKALGLLISINTNGSLITDEILELFKNNPPTRINVSLYGASEETYTNMCGTESFNKVLSNIKKLKEAGLQVKINMSITPYNCGDMPEMINTVKDLGLHYKATTYMYPQSRQQNFSVGINPGRFTAEEGGYYRALHDYLNLGREEFLRRADSIEKLSFEDDEDCGTDGNDGEGMRCRAGTSSCWINWKGEMGACGMFTDGYYSITEHGFDYCWQKVREYVADIRLPAKCTNCTYRNFCPVCAAVCKSETGRFDSISDYVCEFSKSSKRNIQKLAKETKDED